MIPLRGKQLAKADLVMFVCSNRCVEYRLAAKSKRIENALAHNRNSYEARKSLKLETTEFKVKHLAKAGLVKFVCSNRSTVLVYLICN